MADEPGSPEPTPTTLGHAPTIESTPDDDLGSAASLLRAVAAAQGPRGAEAAPLREGQRVAGKYQVVAPIGRGGMGIVYHARDLRLGRDVALKVGAAGSAGALARMEREAQALARLSHPNVVVVHEVGEVDGRVFVAMERVTGGTARAWLAARSRTAREIVALYCAAGDGLAAAHAAGIVHRDVKPDNVLVGGDGRPRVADFGLARGTSDAPDVPAGADASPPLADVTGAGAIVGTPAYMAPEQLTGGPVDARADQFAFAATVWEALYGARPFPGATPDEVAATIESSEPRTSRARRVPRHVDLALRRALRADPAARWASMTALLAELRRDPGRRRRVALLATTAVAAIAAAVLVPLALRSHAPPPCSDDDAALAPVWSDARAEAIARGLGSAGAPTWARLRPRVDRFARDWIAGRHAACTATRVAGAQSEALLDRRMLCLDQARAQLDAILDGLAADGRDAAERGRDELALLPELAACADVAGLDKQAPLPADPAARAAIERTERDLAAARVAHVHHDARDPAATGDRLLAAAKAIGWAPLVARASRARATLLSDAGRADDARAALKDAIALALGAGDDREAARGMAELALDYGNAGDVANARQWLDLARPIWEHTGREPDLGVYLLGAEWLIDVLGGQPDAALDAARRQQELARRAYGDDPFSAAAGHDVLATVDKANDRWADAAREEAAAVDGARGSVGAASPVTARFVANLGEIELKLGKVDDAIGHLRAAIDALSAWYGADDLKVAGPLDTLAQIEAMRGDEAGARAAYDRELAILRAHDPTSRRLPDVEINIGNLLAQFGHLADALPYAERGLAAHRALLGDDNPMLNSDYILLGYAQRGIGKLADAEASDRAAVRVIEARLGDHHPAAVNPRIELSYTLVLEGKAAEAAALLAPMVALAESNPQVPPPAAAEVHMAYADALWKANGDRARARVAAATARDAYAALGHAFEPARVGADAWLTHHR